MLPTTVLDDTDGAGLLAATVAAHGGDAFLSLTSLILTGRGTFTTPPQTGGMTVPIAKFTYTLASSGRSRFVSEGIGMQITVVMRGDGKGGYFYLAGRHLDVPANQIDSVEAFGLLRRAALNEERVTVPASGTTDTADDGKPLLMFQIHSITGQISTVWVESDTRLLRKTVTVTARGEMTMLLGDYKYVDGVATFGIMRLMEDGKDIIELRVSGVTVNMPVNNALFA